MLGTKLVKPYILREPAFSDLEQIESQSSNCPDPGTIKLIDRGSKHNTLDIYHG
jgi:hypothetical protein